MFELIRKAGEIYSISQEWFLAQPLGVQFLAGVSALAVLWVLWIVLRVILVAFRAAFRGL